jgi:tRNA(Ile)-lysidine synthase
MLENVLQDQCGLDPQKPILVGVSGGPDSLCLLDILHTAGYRVIVAHFNHQLRPEAGLEAAAVSALAQHLGLAFVTASADVRSYAGEHGLSLEEAARLLRYRFLFAEAHNQAAQAVAVGHTADDQVETVLMHFLRGAGLSGLKGMEVRSLLPVFDADIPLVRPLLSLWRTDTESYCREHDLRPHYDASNTDQHYFRNRLRHSLIPELEKYNPRFKESLLRTARALQGDHSILQEVLDGPWKDLVVGKGDGWVAFDGTGLAGLTSSLRRDLIRRAAESLRPSDRDFGFAAIERAAAFVKAPAARKIDFVNGLYLFIESGKIYLAAYEADLPSADWPQVKEPVTFIGHEFKLEDGWILTMEENPVDTSPTSLDTEHWTLITENRPLSSDNWSAWLDADRVGDGLIVRLPKPGDRFQPLGMNSGSVKLSDLFVNVKLPRRARKNWPLVCAGEQIAWVPGFRLAHPFRVTEKTRRVLHLVLKKI